MESIRIQMAFQIYNALDSKVKSKEMSSKERDEVITRCTAQWDFRDLSKKNKKVD